MLIKFREEIKPTEKLIDEETIIKKILAARKIVNLDEFLTPKHPNSISLFDFNHIYKNTFNKILNLLQQIKKKKQMIVVYTDYDADGITGGAIMWETLYFLGFNVMPYVPDRRTEGYGFSIKGINRVIEKFNPALIISVDHGITKIKEIQYAKNHGIKIIVTDHHLKGNSLPDAEGIFHIPELSGAGVAYFFAKELFKNLKSEMKNPNQLEVNFQIDYLSLACIGTVADLVPLIGPSRSLVKYGLAVFPKTRRLGIRYILKEAGIEGKTITPYEIGFIIAPRINAAGRLKNAIDALRLLCTKKETKANQLAYHIGQINRLRQQILDKAVEEAKNIVSQKIIEGKNLEKIIILTSNHWHEGIIGLIASRIADEFYRPTIILTKSDGYYKASARSIPYFNITKFLNNFKALLIDLGGHEQAAGFTIEEKQLKKFKHKAEIKADKLIPKEKLEKKLIADLKIPISKVNPRLAKKIAKLTPFGIGNPQPTFYSEAKIIGAKIFGKKNEHLKIFLSDKNDDAFSSSFECIAFNQSQLFYQLSRGQSVKFVYHLELETWKGKEKIRGKILALNY